MSSADFINSYVGDMLPKCQFHLHPSTLPYLLFLFKQWRAFHSSVLSGLYLLKNVFHSKQIFHRASVQFVILRYCMQQFWWNNCKLRLIVKWLKNLVTFVMFSFLGIPWTTPWILLPLERPIRRLLPHVNTSCKSTNVIWISVLISWGKGHGSYINNQHAWTESISKQLLPLWRHQMKTFSARMAHCAGNSPVPVNSPHKGQWRGALTFSLIFAWINDWVKIVRLVIWEATVVIMTLM